MSRPPSALFRTADGVTHRLHPGGIIGRLSSAALRLQDPRVSEAHALLSLRGRDLKLLALRGALGLRGQWRGEITLREGLSVALAQGLAVQVLEVVLPATVLTLQGPGAQQVELDHPELSLYLDPLRAQPGSRSDAVAWVWCSGDAWWLQPTGQPAVSLAPDTVVQLQGSSLRVVAVSLPSLGLPPTQGPGKLYPPMQITIWPQHTEIAVHGRPRPVKLTRNAHALMLYTALLTREQSSIHWFEVAKQIWGFKAIDDNWYTNLARLRDRLRQHGLPPDLLRNVDGQVQIALRPGVDSLTVHGD